MFLRPPLFPFLTSNSVTLDKSQEQDCNWDGERRAGFLPHANGGIGTFSSRFPLNIGTVRGGENREGFRSPQGSEARTRTEPPLAPWRGGTAHCPLIGCRGPAVGHSPPRRPQYSSGRRAAWLSYSLFSAGSGGSALRPLVMSGR